jgi:hypothetical protein
MCQEKMTSLVSNIFPVTRTIDEQVDAVIDLEVN